MNYLIGNWKMKPATWDQAHTLVQGLAELSAHTNVQVVVAPPISFASLVRKILPQYIVIAGQNAHRDIAASQTGETSPTQLASIGADYVILGHSERRRMGETDAQINGKVIAALDAELTPVVCMGEDTRSSKRAYTTQIKQQITETFAGLSIDQFEQLIIAYEPAWAIGAAADREATPDEVNEAITIIRDTITEMTGDTAEGIRIIYGGSSNASNAATFMDNCDIVGLLPGRASLDATEFASMASILNGEVI